MKYANHIILDIKYSRNLLTTKGWIADYNNRIVSETLKKSKYLSYSYLYNTHLNKYNSIVFNNTSFPLNSVDILNLNANSKSQNLNSTHLGELFDINFLRKEHMYTKLKYSRSPQYDIVSGGVAALLAGFFGFLLGEKFGLELLDSGDFYFGLMYVVFICLIGRLFLKIIDDNTSLRDLISCSWLLSFYRDLLILFIRQITPIFTSLVHLINKFVLYVKILEYCTYINYLFWRVINFLRWFPKNKF